MHTSKPKDHHHGKNKNNNNKNNKKSSNKNRSHKNKLGKNQHQNQSQKSPFTTSHDDFYSPSSSANSHSYSGISMPSYTHEFSVSNSDQKDVYFNPGSSSGNNNNHQHTHHHQVHYESQPFKYQPAAVNDGDSEYLAHASNQNSDFSQYNWAPSVTDFGSSASAFNLPTQYTGQNTQLSGAESAQSAVGPIGPVFRPPKKGPAAPFHGKKGSHGAPRAGPRRPPRNNQGESYLRGPAPSKMAGHQHHHNRPEGGLRASASNTKGSVHHSRPRPMMATSATEQQLETVMLPPASAAAEN